MKSTIPFRLMRWLLCLLWIFSIAFITQPVHAAAITVTTTADTIDASANCSSVTVASLPGPGGFTSLREAVCAANSNPGSDTISFSVNGTFTLTGSANEDNGDSGDLDIKQSLSINGNGIGNTILNGGGIERIFDVFPSAATTFGLSNLTIQNGDTRTVSFKEGGAIYLHNNVNSTFTSIQVINNYSGTNGAIENRGTMSISNSTISGNQTIPASGSVVGGGIHNTGSLTLQNVALTNNSVRGEGGGIATTTAAGVTVSMTNCTISGNTASVTGGGLGNGGGISTTGNQGNIQITNTTISGNKADLNGGGAYFVTPAGGTGNVTLTFVTITNNAADQDFNSSGFGGGFAQNTAAVTLQNTIVSGNYHSISVSRDDISGTVAGTSAYNLVGVNSGMLGISNGVNNNQVGTSASPLNAMLIALTNNGGTTSTHPLENSSPALEKIPSGTNGCQTIATDQRGEARPGTRNQPLNMCEIGAWEAQTEDPTAVHLLTFRAQPQNGFGRLLDWLGLGE